MRLRYIIALGLLLCLPYMLRADEPLRVGSERMELLLPLLEGKRVALMANQASLVGARQVHLLDTLLARGVVITKIFVPEHGFRGNVDAGKRVQSGKDEHTGTPIVSLYGRVKRPTTEMLADVDVILFDLQDVGARFYTYISSMHYLMEAVAEQGKSIIVADRPNPNDYIDGPILREDCRSFVGMHPIPIVHGLTVGELAQMINGEGWLREGRKAQLTVIPVEGWRHGQPYDLPVRPSPNLPDARSIALYPSLCLFEATIMSVGRGTDRPFRIVGYPNKAFGKYTFTPMPKPGADSNPRYRGRKCYGTDFTATELPKDKLLLKPLLDYYSIARRSGIALIDRPRMWQLLVGNKELSGQIERGDSEETIRASWQVDLSKYRRMRQRYLIYPDYSEQ